LANDDDIDAGNGLVAAIDLGSNSFHLLIARIVHGEIRPLERLAETVRLAAGMVNGRLQDEALARALACLGRFRQALDALGPTEVRVVGTNALRAASNSRDFRSAAEAVIGHPIEVISGREEARLVYLGVAHTLADDARRLVVDIGGGSTEFIIGERFEARLTESLHMGCVSYRDRFFADGKITAEAFEAAYLAASREVLNIRSLFRKTGWHDAVGSSGTLRAVEQVIVAQGWSKGGFTVENLGKLRKRLLKFNHVDEAVDLPGLSEKRRPVFPSGVAITCAFFDVLGLDRMATSAGALREGVIYDLAGRRAHEDVSERSVAAMMSRYGVDPDSAGTVADTAAHLFASVRGDWQLGDRDGELLDRAARLHEVGLAISHSGFHKHGQYLVTNSDLPGFSRAEQVELGLLVRGHRQKFPQGSFRSRAGELRHNLERLCILLRLAVLFKYVVPVEGSPPYRLRAAGKELEFRFPPGWLAHHPLTRYALENEKNHLARIGYSLVLG
jgi:exopolyphosphatase/guanosine-5'-triphosphate,3'-diphosphate pyrophosphatase